MLFLFGWTVVWLLCRSNFILLITWKLCFITAINYDVSLCFCRCRVPDFSFVMKCTTLMLSQTSVICMALAFVLYCLAMSERKYLVPLIICLVFPVTSRDIILVFDLLLVCYWACLYTLWCTNCTYIRKRWVLVLAGWHAFTCRSSFFVVVPTIISNHDSDCSLITSIRSTTTYSVCSTVCRTQPYSLQHRPYSGKPPKVIFSSIVLLPLYLKDAFS